MRNEQLEKSASQLYSPEYPYHNFEHIRYVLAAGDRIMKRCREEDIEIEESVVYYALLYHDAGYHEDHRALGYDSKEAYSADIAERELKENGQEEEKIKDVKNAILCTHVDAKCLTTEDKAVRAADLSGLAADYKVFKRNTLDLKAELEMMTKAPISWEDWKKAAAERVEQFLRESIHITSDYYDDQGNSVFHTQTRENIKILLADESDQIEA